MVVSKKKRTFAQRKLRPLRNPFYILGSYARYFLTSWHTAGHHIHSPYLFYIAHAILPETARYYCFGDIESAYSQLHKGHNMRPLEIRKQEQIACRLINFQKSETIVVASEGPGTLEAYMAKPSGKAQIICPRKRSQQAEDLWNALAIHNIRVQPTSAALPAQIDFAIVEISQGDQTQTMPMLMQRMGDKSILAIQNIRHSKQTHLQWKSLQQQKRVTASMDLGNMGLLFFDPHFPKEEYRIRI